MEERAKSAAALSMCRYFAVVVVLAQFVATSVDGQSEDFVSIDCGGAGYNSSFNITYVPDTDYIDTGVNRNVISKKSGIYTLYETLRNFPEGTRNCYKLRPVRPGGRYLVRAYFEYGNYDGYNKTPEFDLHIGVNFWATVKDDDKEIITVAPSNSLSICLVNTGRGVPFISGLELRPLSDSMYEVANQSQSLVLYSRRNYGASSQLRFPRDPYDRLWYDVISNFRNVSTTQEVKRRMGGDEFEVPTSVLQTAIVTEVTSYYISLQVIADATADERAYTVLHFADIEQLMSNETREMDIHEGDGRNGRLFYRNYTAPYLRADARVVSGAVGEDGTYNVSIFASASSTRPPILNARESYVLRPTPILTTNPHDVDAMEEIRAFYKATTMNRNWMGDPCAPTQFRWHGVTCDYGDTTRPPRVIGLNLSSSGLSGGLSASLANLTALKTLDLSSNNLSGAIPLFLEDIPSLKQLILTGNQLSGPIPSHLCEKKRSGVLSISIEDNFGACAPTNTRETKKKKTFTLVAIIAAVSAVLALFVICIILWRIRTRRNSTVTNRGLSGTQQSREAIEMNVTPNSSHVFTFAEIEEITNYFEKAIGKGGFGTVYFGHLNDGSGPATQVAVKVLSQLSSQGFKEFRAEAMMLTRVHHKNLVALLGFCHDENNLALVYEYMNMGSLHDHLSGKAGNLYALDWEQRAMVAVHAAQGLDYLHNGCKPPIVHRDVKSSNILLNHDFTAKLADFGLSRFSEENGTTTAVAGTPGYLDPEYYQTYRLNARSDVYSFGIVLLEIITGQPVFLNWPERTHITQWVQSRTEDGDGGGIDNIVDARLGGRYNIHSARRVLEIAMACTTVSSERRLTMSSVLTKLKECFKREVPDDVIGVPGAASVARRPVFLDDGGR